MLTKRPARSIVAGQEFTLRESAVMRCSELFALPSLGPVSQDMFPALVRELAMQTGSAVRLHVQAADSGEGDDFRVDAGVTGALGARLRAFVKVVAAGNSGSIGTVELDGSPAALFLAGELVHGRVVSACDPTRLAVTLQEGILPRLSAALVEAALDARSGQRVAVADAPVGALNGWPDEFDMDQGVLKVQRVESAVALGQCGDASGPGGLLRIVRRSDGTLWARGLHVHVPDLGAGTPGERLEAAMASVEAMVAQGREVVTLREQGRATYELSRLPRAVPLLKRADRSGERTLGRDGEAVPAFLESCRAVLGALLS